MITTTPQRHTMILPSQSTGLSLCCVVLCLSVCVRSNQRTSKKNNTCQTLVNSVCPSSPFLGEWGWEAVGVGVDGKRKVGGRWTKFEMGVRQYRGSSQSRGARTPRPTMFLSRVSIGI